MRIEFESKRCFWCGCTINDTDQHVGLGIDQPSKKGILISNNGYVRTTSDYYKVIKITGEDILSGKVKLFSCKDCWNKGNHWNRLRKMSPEEYRKRGFEKR